MEEALKNKIKKIVNKYKTDLENQILTRKEEMEADNTEHYMMYELLGIDFDEGKKIDLYQNVGRFVYKYAGSMLEEIVILCFKEKYFYAEEKKKLKNTVSTDPKTVEIDVLYDNRAHEIKWRDATTDGDHIKKEKNRIKVVLTYGYTPIRLMFFKPNRQQAINIQNNLRILYNEVGGEYYSGSEAWNYLYNTTGVKLKEILELIIEESKIVEVN